MNKTTKYILIGAGGAGLAYGIKRLIDLDKAGDKLTIRVSKVKDIKHSGSGILGHIAFSIDLTIINPTSTKFNLEVPSIKVLYNNAEIGYTLPVNRAVVIGEKAQAVFSDIQFQIPVTSIPVNNIIQAITNLDLNPIINSLAFEVFTKANGVELNFIIPCNEDLGLTASGKRNIKSGKEYDNMFPSPALADPLLHTDGNVEQTINFMKGIVAKYHNDTSKIASVLKGKTTFDSCRNIFDFCYSHIQYELDKHGVEQLRRPARTWMDRKTGVDCDCFSIFVGSILYNLNIPFEFRITKYNGKANFQHVYVIIPVDNGSQHYIIDPVIDQFNHEKKYSEKKDYAMTTINKLNGIPIQFLNGVSSDAAMEVADIIIGNDLNGIEGLGSTQEQTEAIFKYLVKTRNAIASNPDMISKVQNPEKALEMFNYAIKYWHTDKRDEALERLAQAEDVLINQGNILFGTEIDDDDEDDDEWEEDFGFTGVEPEDSDYEYNYYEEEEDFSGSEPDELGRRRGRSRRNARRVKRKTKKRARKLKRAAKKKTRKKKGFFNKVKHAVKKVGKGVLKVAKKAVNAVIKYNPLSIAARNGFLLAMKINMFKLGDKLQYAYLSESEARSKGLDMAEWKKLKSAHAKVEKMFTKTLKGKSKNLRNAILSGKRKHLRGLGVEPVTTAAGTAAASGFLATVVSWLKNINFGSLLKKNPEKQAYKEAYAAQNQGNSKGWKDAFKAQKNPSASSPNSIIPNSIVPPLAPQLAPSASSFSPSTSLMPADNPMMVSRTKQNTSSSGNPPPKSGFINKAKSIIVKNKVASGIGLLVLVIGGLLAFSKKTRNAVGIGKKEEKGSSKSKKKSNKSSLKGTVSQINLK